MVQKFVGDVIFLPSERVQIDLLSQLRLAPSFSTLQRKDQRSILQSLEEAAAKPPDPFAALVFSIDNVEFKKKGRDVTVDGWIIPAVAVIPPEKLSKLGLYSNTSQPGVVEHGSVMRGRTRTKLDDLLAEYFSD